MMTKMTRHFTTSAKPGEPPDRGPAPAPPRPPWWRVWLLPAGFLLTFLLFSIGVFLWLLYGLYINSKPVIASNSVTLVLSVSILILKLHYDRNPNERIDP